MNSSTIYITNYINKKKEERRKEEKEENWKMHY